VRYTALLDANVLVPYTLTDVLLRLAEAESYRPLWSAEVLVETERTLAHMYPDVDSARFHDRLAAMDRSFTDASVTGWESLVESFDLPDPGDRHVVAAAVMGGADAIVTANLNDFPDDALGAFDLVATHPDDFVLDQWDLNPDLAAQVLRDTATARQRPEVTVADVLGQLTRSGAPQFSALAAAVLHPTTLRETHHLSD